MDSKEKIWKVSMNRQQAIDILAKLKPELVNRFGVTRLALLGSTLVPACPGQV